MMKEQPSITAWNELLELYKRFYSEEDTWVFRGQPGGWPLKTSLERACNGCKLEPDKVLALEKRLIREFARRFHFYSPMYSPILDDNLEWLALMQHYGAPTRLLDWTYSFYVAAYFAFEKTGETGKHVIWALNHDWVVTQTRDLLEKVDLVEVLRMYVDNRESSAEAFSQLFMRDTPIPFVYPVNPFKLNERLTIQKGLFLCPGDISKSFIENLSALGNLSANLIRIEIDKRIRSEALVYLDRVNMTSASLFPGLDGLARSLWTQVPLLSSVRLKLEEHEG
ncbi:MAG: FRG domain-containing protein [Pseudomonadota bacterium]|nr:FRG domain-containing protein [Pseudomonadota bacterium]